MKKLFLLKLFLLAGLILCFTPFARAQCPGSSPTWNCPSGTTSATVNATMAQAGFQKSDTILFAGTLAAHGTYTFDAPMPFSLTKGATMMCATSPSVLTITSIGAVRTTNVVTITTSAAHGLTGGMSVIVGGVTDSTFNGTQTVVSTPSSTTFTYNQTAANASSGNGVAVLTACDVTTTASYAFGIPTWGGLGYNYYTELYRVSGFNFLNFSQAHIPIYWGAQTNAVNDGVFTNIVIDNNIFNGNGTVNDLAIKLTSTGHRTYFYGPIARNTIICSNSCQLLLGATNKLDPQPPPNPLGTGNNIFLEDNIYTLAAITNSGESILDWDYGTQPLVARHNSGTNTLWSSHYTMLNYEFYNNDLTFNAGATSGFSDCYRALHSQTNSLGMVFNNALHCTTGPNSDTLEMASIREGYKVDPRAFPVTLKCTGYVTYSSFGDGNRLPSATNQGYPCQWQPGRDQATKALFPIYTWNNTKAGVLAKLFLYDLGSSTQIPDYAPKHIKANREYYNTTSITAQSNSTTPWNCNTGTDMSFGPLGNRPTAGSCPAYTGEAGGGLGYAAQTTAGTIGANLSGGVASDDVLYQLGASGWTQIYKPYIYPHPFFGGTAQAAFPVISLTPGAFLVSQSGVTLTDGTAGATICYTLDSTAPTTNGAGTCTAPTLTYSTPLTISATGVVNAIATKSGLVDSLTLSAPYYIGATAYPPFVAGKSDGTAAPPGSYPAGTLNLQVLNPGQVTRNCLKIDGTTPTSSGLNDGLCGNSGGTGVTPNGITQFSSVTLSASATVKAMTVGVGFTPSAVVTGVYTLGGTNGLWWEDVSPENFGNEPINVASGTLPIFLNNPGTTSTTVTGVSVTGSAFTRVTDGCNAGGVPFTIAAGSWCALLYTFTPTIAQAYSETVTITSNVAGSPQTLTLTGTGTSSAQSADAFSPASGVSFGNIVQNTTSGTQTVTVCNGTFNGASCTPSTAALTITSITLTGTDAARFAIFQDNCTSASPIAAGSTCTMLLTFTPNGTTPNPFTANLHFITSAATSPDDESLSGVGIAVNSNAGINPQGVVY